MQISTRVLQPDYDAESDTLYLHSVKEKSAASVSFGNLVIDFAKDGSVVGLEFLDATESITPLLVVSPKELYQNEKRLKAEALQHITKANVSVDTIADFFLISFTFQVDKQAFEGRLNLPIPASSQEEMMHILSNP